VRATIAAIFVAVDEGHVAAHRVARELLRHIGQQATRVGGDQRFELTNTGKRAAVGEGAGGVDGLAQLEADADEGIDCAARGIIARADRAVRARWPPMTSERLEREARGVDLRVAGGADGVAAVLSSCSRIVVAPRTSGSTAATLEGGGSGG